MEQLKSRQMKDYTQFLTHMKETKAIDLAFDFKPSPMTVVISEQINPTQRTIERIKYAVKIAYGLDFHEINVKSRKRHIIDARRALTYYVKQRTTLSLKAIGRIFTGQTSITKFGDIKIGFDHTSIMWAIQEYDKFLKFDKDIKSKDDKIKSILNNV